MRVVQHRGWCRQGEGEGGRGEEGCTDGMMDEPTANWFEPTTGLNRHLPRSTCARPMRRHHCLLGGRRGSRKVGAAGHFLRTAGHCLRMRPQKNDHDIEQARSATRSQQAIRPSYTCAHSHTRARMCTQHTHACKHARMRHTHMLQVYPCPSQAWHTQHAHAPSNALEPLCICPPCAPGLTKQPFNVLYAPRAVGVGAQPAHACMHTPLPYPSPLPLSSPPPQHTHRPARCHCRRCRARPRRARPSAPRHPVSSSDAPGTAGQCLA